MNDSPRNGNSGCQGKRQNGSDIEEAIADDVCVVPREADPERKI